MLKRRHKDQLQSRRFMFCSVAHSFLPRTVVGSSSDAVLAPFLGGYLELAQPQAMRSGSSVKFEEEYCRFQTGDEFPGGALCRGTSSPWPPYE
mmetsp:Transcript_83083/g.222009  ORF Transcript_83083/g.222009 Transcript_83083/m.222009 type:complete len:93 (+) Transcript_83083:1064-1342(+)